VFPTPTLQPPNPPQVLFDEEPTIDGALASVDNPALRRQLADRCMLKSYNLAQGEGAAQVPALALLVPKEGLEVWLWGGGNGGAGCAVGGGVAAA